MAQGGCLESGYSSESWKIKGKTVTRDSAVRAMLESDDADERHEKIRRNLRKLRAVKLDGDIISVSSATCLANNIFVCNKHFLDKCTENNGLIEMSEHGFDGDIIRYVRLPMQSFKQVVCPSDVSTSDAVLVYTGRFIIPRARDITAFIPLKGEKSGVLDATFLQPNYEDDRCGKVDVGTWKDVVYSTGILGDKVVRVTSGFKFFSKKGDCGLPYLDSSNTPLLGIHCAAYTRSDQRIVGIALLWREMVEELRSVYPQRVEVECEVLENWDKPIFAMKNVRSNGKIINSNCSPTTSIVRMQRNGIEFNHPNWPDGLKPAILGKVGDVDPWNVGIDKYVPKAVITVPDVIDRVVTEYWIEVLKQDTSGKCIDRVYTFDEALNGVTDPNGMRPMQWGTGMGIWAIYKEKGKGGLFKQVTNEDGEIKRELAANASNVVHPVLGVTFVERLRQFEQMIREGVVPFSPWIGTLKDELRPIARVNVGATRIFEQPGVDYTIMLRKYFGSFLDWLKSRAGFEWCHGIGQDKETAWKAYYEGLCEVGDGECAFDLDYTGYDGSVGQQAFIFFENVTDAFYERTDLVDPGAKVARHALLDGLRNAPVVLKRIMVETVQGNKSGNAMTDVFNSVTNVYILHCAYLIMQKGAGLRLDPGDFHRSNRVLVYGDDVIWSTTREHKTWLDPTVMGEVLTLLGYQVTSAQKTKEIAYASVTELVFLKSRFVPSGGVVWAPMPIQNVVKELQWCKKAQLGDDVDFRERIVRTRQFMAHHGKEAFMKFNTELSELGVPKGMLLTTWESEREAVAIKQASAKITSSPACPERLLFK